MNLSKAWNTKLEVASFLLSKILSKKCGAKELAHKTRMKQIFQDFFETPAPGSPYSGAPVT